MIYYRTGKRKQKDFKLIHEDPLLLVYLKKKSLNFKPNDKKFLPFKVIAYVKSWKSLK